MNKISLQKKFEEIANSTANGRNKANLYFRSVLELWPLSQWIFTEEFLWQSLNARQIRSHSTKVPGIQRKLSERLSFGKGECYILFAKEREELPFLRQAFLLPLIWKANTQDDPSLPKKLKQAADQARNNLQYDNLPQDKQSSSWGLHFSFPPQKSSQWDWEELGWSYASGWANLEAALRLSIWGVTPEANIWASAAWNQQQGITKVEGLDKKLSLLYEIEAKKLFVPPSNLEEAQKFSRQLAEQNQAFPIEIFPLNNTTNPAIALRPYLQALDYPPSLQEPLVIRCNYYRRQLARDPRTANQYYDKFLIQDLAEKCRQNGIDNLPPNKIPQLKNLISFLSFNYQGSLFVLSTIRPKNLLLFHTPDTKKHLSHIQNIIHPYGKLHRVEIQNNNTPEEDQAIYHHIQKFTQQHPAESIAVDLTPGPKNFTQLASWSLDPKKHTFLYLCHHYDGQNKCYHPGQEKIRYIHPFFWDVATQQKSKK